MKTWEVFKPENRNKKFKRMSSSQIYEFNPDGNLAVACAGFVIANPSIDEEWQLIETSVDFMTAAKAFQKGKNIRCEYPSAANNKEIRECLFVQGNTDSFGIMRNKDILTFHLALHGKWYIED